MYTTMVSHYNSCRNKLRTNVKGNSSLVLSYRKTMHDTQFTDSVLRLQTRPTISFFIILFDGHSRKILKCRCPRNFSKCYWYHYLSSILSDFTGWFCPRKDLFLPFFARTTGFLLSDTLGNISRCPYYYYCIIDPSFFSL